MALSLFRKKQDSFLERRILRFITRAEELIESDPDLGLRYLNQANKDYGILDYNSGINCRINDICFAYGRRLPNFSH